MQIGEVINGKKISGLFGGAPVVVATSDELRVGDKVLVLGSAQTIEKIRKPSASRVVVDFRELGYGMKFMRRRIWQKIEEEA